MREALSAEQHCLCCYCAGTIAHGAFHIEHFKPREAFEQFTYTWRNLLASCQGGGQQNLVRERRHCGIAKDNWFEDGVTVDPLRASVERLFHYTLIGKIFPGKKLDKAQADAAGRTIETLNLNAPVLIERRGALLAKAAMDANEMDRAAWRARYLDVQGDRLQEFWPALNYNYTRHWSRIFDERAGQA